MTPRWETEAPGRTTIERWILEDLAPVPTTSAELTYERMESQSDRKLPVIYEPLDHRVRSHWHDCALIAAIEESLRGATTVLDVGPGDGWPALRIAGRFERVVGIDASRRRVRVQRENAERLGIGNVTFIEADVAALPLWDGSVGGVVAASSIEQCERPEIALAEVARVLEPGGRLAMLFEDYGDYFPDSAGDEEMWYESGESPVLFYQRRTKDPPRERTYGLFLDLGRLGDDAGLIAALGGLEATAAGVENAEAVPAPPPWVDRAFLAALRPLVERSSFFELRHFTSASLDRALDAAGFVDVRHLSHRIPEILAVFDAALQEDALDMHAASFEATARAAGIAAVRAARSGPGDFAIARRRSGGGGS